MEVALHRAIVHEELPTERAGLLDFVGVKFGKLIVLQFRHGLGQHFLVRFVTQVGHKSALLRAEQVARPTDVEVLHGDVDARPEVGKIFDGLQPAAGLVGQEGKGRCEQVAEGFARPAPHAATHLVKVRKAEAVGCVDDDGVGIGYVDAVFHDGRGNEHVVVVIDKAHDDFFQLLGRHLPMTDGDAGIGHVFLDQGRKVGQGRHTVGHDVHLAVAAHLEIHRLGNHLVAEGMYFGLDGAAVGRRCLDDAEVARPHERKLEGTRDGRGRHREGVDIDLQLA